ncbi:Flp pilus assembly protein CpaB [Plantactinospora siamensis]|uniref:Flp pilus assembly protein CpaB n=1 Tax=Plantactinospora siamensis TaxID=555372 RepID=A0ABV6NRY2_9ACTN
MNRRVISVVLAVVLAAIGTGAVLLYLRSADARATAGKQARTVLVADKQIPAGTSGRALRSNGYLRAVPMPVGSLPEDTLGEVGADLDTMVVTSAVQRGQLLLRAMFGTAVKNGSGVAIPDGQLAVSARVTSTVFSPSSVRAGTRVAIFYTYTPADPAKRDTVSGAGLEKGRAVNSVTRLLMTNVEVISVEAAAKGSGGDAVTSTGGGKNEFEVTFGLNQRDAERLAHAVALGGAINIGLLGDTSDVKPDTGVDNRSLFG